MNTISANSSTLFSLENTTLRTKSLASTFVERDLEDKAEELKY